MFCMPAYRRPADSFACRLPFCRAAVAPLALAIAVGFAACVAAGAEPLHGGSAPARYAAAPGDNLGGGFLEFLASGGAARPRLGRAPASIDPDAWAPSDPRYARQVVDYSGNEKPGTVIIDTPKRLLYLVEPGGKAWRYGIGVGRPGFTWAGVKYVSMKREWPDWRPPEEMLRRKPDLPTYMPGGPDNPLGARALYLGSSLYRIHGSNEPWTIGTQVSSGCIRMRNEDVIDLYDRVPVGAKVVVM
jgi:lipoprotein-anchoring transpeptidase ErfK/SrfK